MSFLEMEPVTPNNGKYTCNHEREIEVIEAGASPWVILPVYAKFALISLEFNSGQARIEVTNSLYDRIKADPETAHPVPYRTLDTDPDGNITVDITAETGPVKAVRCFNLSGTQRIVVSAG